MNHEINFTSMKKQQEVNRLEKKETSFDFEEYSINLSQKEKLFTLAFYMNLGSLEGV